MVIKSQDVFTLFIQHMQCFECRSVPDWLEIDIEIWDYGIGIKYQENNVCNMLVLHPNTLNDIWFKFFQNMILWLYYWILCIDGIFHTECYSSDARQSYFDIWSV